MKYFDINTVVNSYIGFQDCMTNKSWGYLALLKGCKHSVRPFVPYEVDLDCVSNFLETIFNLSQTKKEYKTGRSLFVIFSNKWDKYFKDQGKYTPNIIDVAVWTYRRKMFSDEVTTKDVLLMFAKEFNISFDIIKASFGTEPKELTFSDNLYSEASLSSALSQKGVDVSKGNIDAKKSAVVASPGEISRGPFVQTLYAGLEITDYVIILQSDYSSLYKGNSIKAMEPKDNTKYRPYITAIKSKPFLLLAGISGTGKSRIVRELARACWDVDSEEYKAHKPRNFEMIQVKPNWHDSSELIGYVSRVSGNPIYVAGDFLKFVARAWGEPEVPYFLCLDEMNLAPVEQYFAEYLSVIESRKVDENGEVVTDPILMPEYEEKRDATTGDLVLQEWYRGLISMLLSSCPTENALGLYVQFKEKGISLPQNLIVVGTVNMDETTFSFSRKVLDRAMTIEMNEVDLEGGLTERYEQIGKLSANELIGTAVEGVDVYSNNKAVCDVVISYLKKVNSKLEGTPFKIAYRTRNEFLLYVVNNLPYKKNSEGEDFTEEYVIARALDEITSMKILSRIEGDETKVSRDFIGNLKTTIKEGLKEVSGLDYSDKNEDDKILSVSLSKLNEMEARLESGYTSFWS